MPDLNIYHREKSRRKSKEDKLYQSNNQFTKRSMDSYNGNSNVNANDYNSNTNKIMDSSRNSRTSIISTANHNYQRLNPLQNSSGMENNNNNMTS
jgi:hypothetical protein